MSARANSLPQTKTNLRGTNVRAFIQMVESGNKPQPDFFNSDSKNPKQTNKSRTFSGSKPPILTTKPSLKHGRHSPALVIVSSSCRAQPKRTTGDTTPKVDEEDSALVEVNCPSEDSGHSTCDLKYSGSLSSNHSSSHDPNYQVLSELDDTYSERTSSSYGTTSSAANELPQYSDPSVVETTTEDAPKHRRTASGGGANRAYVSTYKYHVPSKLNGTLPRDRKKAAVIGKAVAKGRATLKKKPIKTGEDNSNASYTLSSCKYEVISSARNASELTESDVEFDSDISDSDWETDSENSDRLPADNQQSSEAKTDNARLSTNVDNNNEDSDDSDYDTCIPVQTVGESKSRSKFYTHEYEDAQQLLDLMRERSGKKQAIEKKRLDRVKGSIQDLKRTATVQKFMQSSNSKLAAVKTFLAGKRKKGKADSNIQISRTNITIERMDSNANDSAQPNTISNSMDMHHSDSQSDVNSVSSHNSHGPSSDPGRIFIPREKAPLSSNNRTHSAGSVQLAPPLPPRNVKSMHHGDGVDLGVLPAPPPPPRTTSKAESASAIENEPYSYPEIEGNDVSQANPSYPRRFKPKSPKPLPRTSKLGECDTSQQSTLSLQSSARLVEEEPHIHKTASVPALSGATLLADPTSSSPHIPMRKESSLTLVIPSSDDESIRRRNEIINSAKATVGRKDSSKTTPSPIKEEVPAADVLRTKSPITDSNSPRIKESSRVSSQLRIEDEPLYQAYHECILSSVKDRSRNKSKTSTLMRGGQPNTSLWSKTMDVLNSGVLEHMTDEEIKLQEAMFEVITSEASYLRSIIMLRNVFYDSKEFCNEEILCARDKKDLFSNITAVLDVSTRLFADLEEHWKSSVILTSVCELISNYAYSEFDVYIKYCSNQAFQDKTLKKLSTNPKFQEALAALEKSSECQGLSMSSFLLLPMQRITRLPLLLDAILRRQEMGSNQYHNAQKCYDLVKKVVSRCNDGARKMEQTEQIINIENKLLFNKLKKIPLASQSRQLVKQGDLVHMSADGAKSTTLLTVKPKTLCLFLFNDVMLITKKKGDYYAVVDYASRAHISTEQWGADLLSTSRAHTTTQKSQAKAKFMFMLVLLQNHQKKHSEFLFNCQSETERTRWVEAFRPPVPDDSDEKIYESWDCPQVQVTHDYTAQEPDELNLQTGDVVNVLRKTPDGWYEGERVSDGKRGWLPNSYTFELQNEHVRARHLKERNKLLQAAAKHLR